MIMNFKVGMTVIFAGSHYTIVKVKEEALDIRQNFSIGVVYEDIKFDEVSI